MLSSVRRPPPQVTGISPKEGPPGTRVTIRGENLGVDPRDLIGLRICGVDCLLTADWKSPNKILARTNQAKGLGDIIVVTRSGGVGNSTVNYRGYNIQIGPLQESAVWIDETQTYHTMFSRNRASSPMSSTENDDPLGISDESNDTKFKEEKLLEMFPEGSGNTNMKNFEPAWYLVENHHQTSFDDLKAGLNFLKHKSSTQNEGPMTFVKSNLTTFLDCLDTLADMKQAIAEDRSSASGGNVTESLEETLHKANKAADALFHDVLGRKDRADATRNALGVLQRFKFLFYLPCTIEHNIKKGDYDLVITDYTRAKSLFGDTEVVVFQKVYAEVEQRIAAFRTMLYKKLMEMPASVEEQKKLIRYLVHLERPGDTAWECLQQIQHWLTGVLHNCKEEHLLKEIEREKEQRERAASPLSPTIGTPINRPSRSGGRAPQKVLFVDHLTRLLCEHLPDLWRLGQSYFSGKLLKEMRKPSRGDPNKHAQFKTMVTDVVLLYSRLVRASSLPVSLESMDKSQRPSFGYWRDRLHHTDSPLAWLPVCVRHVRACLSSIGSMELPQDAMEILQDLTFDLRCNCMSTLLGQAAKDVQNLHASETWTVDTDDARGGTTLLPALFENIVNETIQHLQEVLQARTGEAELFSEVDIQKDVVRLCGELLQSFAATMEQLALLGNLEVQPSRGSRSSAITPDGYASGHAEPGIPPLDRRLLIMMSNCAQTVENILPRLVESLQRHGYPDTYRVKQVAVGCYRDLDQQLFDKYIEEKTNPILGSLEQNMYQGQFDWSDAPKPLGVRNYLKEAIMGMIEIHAEVYSVSPKFVERVMHRVMEVVTEESCRLFQCITSFNSNGSVQANVEVSALEATILPYRTETTQGALREAIAVIPRIKTQIEQKQVDELLLQFKTHMNFHLKCFQRDSLRERKTAAALN